MNNLHAHSNPERLLRQVREIVDPASLESRMDAAVNCDSEVVHRLRRLFAEDDLERLRRDPQIGRDRREATSGEPAGVGAADAAATDPATRHHRAPRRPRAGHGNADGRGGMGE